MHLIVVAHPDDEVIGVGGQLASLPDVWIAYVTDGAPRDMQDAVEYGFATAAEYASARRNEARDALAAAAIAPCRAIWLDVPDQEASRDMASLARRICGLVADLQPSVVWTHPYEGGHPDHDAAALAVQAACAMAGSGSPERREFTSYHGRGCSIVTYEFLPHPDTPETIVELDAESRRRKSRMFDAYRTQQRTLEVFRCGSSERWRRAPVYDFTSPPHAGTLYYDQFSWGIESAEWRILAASALREMGL